MISLAELLGPGLAWEDDQSVIELTGLAWMHELRNKRGEWAKTPGDSPGQGIHRYVVPDHARLTRGVPKNAAYADPADDPVWRGDKPDPANIIKAYEAAKAIPGAVEDGRAWYPQMHKLAGWIGQGNAEEGAILLSTYSPQKSWPANMLQAARSGERGRALGPGEGMMISGAQQKKAQAAIDGAGITELMKTSKTHSFARLLARGGDDPSDPYGHVVIDRHALSVAVGRQIEPEKGGGPDGRLYAKVNGDSRYHEYVADAYRRAAAEISAREGKLMSPYELQAITWLVQKAHNEASGSGGKALSKGRATMTRNAWAAWMDHAARHGIPTVPGISEPALAGLGPMIELAFWDALLHPRGAHGEFAPTGMKSRYSHGGAFAELHDTGPRTAFAERLVAGPGSRPGDAGEVLRKMHADADRLGVTIEGEVHPLEGVQARHPMTSGQLRAWYAKFGYKPTGQPFRVARRPVSLAAELHKVHRVRSGLSAELAFDPLEPRNVRGEWARAGESVARSIGATLHHPPPGGPGSKEARRGAPEVVRMLGGGHSGWTGRSYQWKEGDPAYKGVSGEITWRGDIGLSPAVARAVDDPSGKAVSPHAVVLHELIHSVVPEGEDYKDHEDAYQDPDTADIEEGFTELGTTHHAAEYFDKIGIGGRPTFTSAQDELGNLVPNPGYSRRVSALAGDLQRQWAKLVTSDNPEKQAQADRLGEMIEDLKHRPGSLREYITGTAHDPLQDLLRYPETRKWARAQSVRAFEIIRDVPEFRPYTFREMAEKHAGTDAINSGTGWGVYYGQTYAANQWVSRIAEAEGHHDLEPGTPGRARAAGLADEINRRGPGGKAWVMAGQVLRAEAGKQGGVRPVPGYSDIVQGRLEHQIRSTWRQHEAAGDAYDAAVSWLREQARTSPPGWFEGGKPYEPPSWGQLTGGRVAS